MTNMKRIFRVVLTGAALGALMPAYAWAQASARPAPPAYAVADATAAELLAQAQTMFAVPSRFGEAAEMLEQAAYKKEVHDFEAAELLIWAARIQVFTGDLQRARVNMQEGAWRALGNGKLLTAANAYADAALIAVQQKDKEGAKELCRIARLLADWPKVSAATRKQILNRVS